MKFDCIHQYAFKTTNSVRYTRCCKLEGGFMIKHWKCMRKNKKCKSGMEKNKQLATTLNQANK